MRHMLLGVITSALFLLASSRPTHSTENISLGSKCSSEVARYNSARRQGRNGLTKRTFYPGLQNLTCIAAPETPLDNYVANPPVRQDVTEGQVGVPLTLDIGVIDVTTCQPLANTMIEVWSANAVGEYGETFLRGGTPTSSNGIAEFQTIFPGHTSDSANHINLMVQTAGKVSHVGQVFFTDKWTDVINENEVFYGYAKNTNKRVLNGDDAVFNAANAGGFNPIVDIESIEDDWPTGVVGYITVGIDPERDSGMD